VKISDPDMLAAWDTWWVSLTRSGDPVRNPKLASKAFVAGYEAGMRAQLFSENVAYAVIINALGDSEGEPIGLP
jgi:hypothetical protein